ncbi:MAG: hypothetical protein PHS73_02005 [Candidatus Peribacteraceae bacterium]|nr:hypothetical protein [Candidatus Peribacteraceae bacterium]
MEHFAIATPEYMNSLLGKHRPELLNGSATRQKLEHVCRSLRGSPQAGDKIFWDQDVAPCGVRCHDEACKYRLECQELMQGSEKHQIPDHLIA